ncbi:unnamed protein product [Effrenium voratum]|uniref:Uncharacterized protein n=1 Tax=Effrenium voratum TaxID=2562239 RepID=A0AA36I333_9DINO|nr:unnamed protein product [Effrenium voratum]CAJ1380166.1 unnamed protein product [Effrenium voratum]
MTRRPQASRRKSRESGSLVRRSTRCGPSSSRRPQSRTSGGRWLAAWRQLRSSIRCCRRSCFPGELVQNPEYDWSVNLGRMWELQTPRKRLAGSGRRALFGRLVSSLGPHVLLDTRGRFNKQLPHGNCR